jgi:hypothetical protein
MQASSCCWEKLTSAVMIPESIPLVSVSSAASRRLAAILRHASDTAVASGSVSALVSLSFFTVRRSCLRTESAPAGEGRIDRKRGSAAYESLTGEVGLDDVDAFQLAAGGGGGARRGCGAAILASYLRR